MYAFELGERKIIELMLNAFERMPDAVLSFDEDVSAVDIGRGRVAVIKTDTLVGKTDIPPGMTLFQAARKAVVMNVSDFAAKGVKPLALLSSVAFPPHFRKREICQVAEGLNVGAREHGAYVIGGDTSEVSVDVIISCFLFGIGRRKYLMRRRGARPNDIVAVTGNFGKTSAGLKILLEKKNAPKRLKRKLLNPVYMPKARLKEGLALAEEQVVTSSIDSSDGLAWSLYELSKVNDVGFVIDMLPIAPEAERFAKINNLDARSLALYGGEEYELVLTIDPKGWDRARRALEEAGGKLIKIGFVTKEPEIVMRLNGELVQIEPRGFEHFRS